MNDWQSYFDENAATLSENRKFIEEEKRLNEMLLEIQERISSSTQEKPSQKVLSFLDAELTRVKARYDQTKSLIEEANESDKKQLELHLLAIERYFIATMTQFKNLKAP